LQVIVGWLFINLTFGGNCCPAASNWGAAAGRAAAKIPVYRTSPVVNIRRNKRTSGERYEKN
jgi:hypothetical protein